MRLGSIPPCGTPRPSITHNGIIWNGDPDLSCGKPVNVADACKYGKRQALQEMHIPVEGMVCMHSLNALPEAADIIHFEREKERIDYLKSQKDAWLLGSLEMEQLAATGNYFTCVSAPFYGRAQIATHLPIAGEKGMDYLMEEADCYFERAGI